MNKTTHTALDVVFYIIVFLLLQLITNMAFGVAAMWHDGQTWSAIGQAMAKGTLPLTPKVVVAAMVASSLLTLLLFVQRRWVTASRSWLVSHPWGVLAWTATLALGTILPSEWMVEQLQVSMPDATEHLLESIMHEPSGYLAIGILGPVAEEVVFRGAVLRTLLQAFSPKAHWLAIFLSAALFGAVHLNMAQFVHALPIGLLLGWMFYRTGSIMPGLVFHWVNNTVAYIAFNLMPQMADGKLIDLFHGNTRTLWMAMGFSLCIILPSIFQLHLRMRKE